MYISCNPESCASDVIALCAPKGEQQQQQQQPSSKRQRHQEQQDAKKKKESDQQQEEEGEEDEEQQQQQQQRPNAVDGSGNAVAGDIDTTPAREPFRPFVPIRLAAVDLFPYAKHCESITLLERAPQSVSSSV